MVKDMVDGVMEMLTMTNFSVLVENAAFHAVAARGDTALLIAMMWIVFVSAAFAMT